MERTDWRAARGEKWCAHLVGLEAMLAPVDEPLIDALELHAPQRIADIGCGGGGTALRLRQRAPAGSTVHGFDVSPASVEAARARVPPGERSLAFEVADVATAPATRGPYDRLGSRFGVMFFEEPRAAFSNLLRWLVPGGRLAFAVWGAPADNPWVTTVHDVVAALVDVPPAEPDAPGPFRYAEASALVSLLEDAGFVELHVQRWCGALPIGGTLAPAQAARFALASFSSFGERLAEAGGDASEAAQRALTASFSRHQRDGAVWLDASVHIVTGARARGAAPDPAPGQGPAFARGASSTK